MGDGFVQRGGFWVLGQGFLMAIVAALGALCPGEPRLPGLMLRSGQVLLAGSALCGFFGLLALGRNLTPFPKPSANARFVQRGIYSLMRHPLYTAVFCGAAGWSLLRESWPAVAVCVLLGWFFDAKARREERWLRVQFPGYTAYEQRVRRFIPWVY